MTVAAVVSACSSTKASSSTETTCSTPTGLQLVFSPMYSAVIPGDDTHTFAVPVIVNGATGDAVTWRTSDPTAVRIDPDALTGGVLLTMLSTATASSARAPVTITANTKSACGTSTLTITPGTTDEWNAGEARYNDGVPVDGGLRAACSDCHAPHADAGHAFNDIAHTPEQTGGFSDTQLVNIIQNAEIPDGGYFDPTIVSYLQWRAFHQWNLTAAEKTGLVLYLRSLVPTAQTGTSNFGGSGSGSGG